MKRENLIGNSAAVVVLAICVLLGLLMNSCTIESKSGKAVRARAAIMQDSYIAQADTARWTQFLECSREQGDAGCDSCFTAIYGYSLEER